MRYAVRDSLCDAESAGAPCLWLRCMSVHFLRFFLVDHTFPVFVFVFVFIFHLMFVSESITKI